MKTEGVGFYSRVGLYWSGYGKFHDPNYLNFETPLGCLATHYKSRKKVANLKNREDEEGRTTFPQYS